MKRAIISDIHGNLEALNAVMADIEHQNIDEIYCLGDVVGYGPNPIECLDWVRRLMREGKLKECILGNHDYATIFDPDGFNPMAAQAALWTRECLENCHDSESEERWDFINSRPRARKIANETILLVHGSPILPLTEYVFYDEIHNEGKMARYFSLATKICFMGHTHYPGVFTESCEFFPIRDLDNGCFSLDDEKVMINVGSVGQPRDHDPRACYVVFHDDQYIEYRRVGYDIETTCKKISAIPDLDDYLGERLRSGK